MNEGRIIKKPKSGKTRTFEFIHIGEIIPGVLGDIEKRIKENTKCNKLLHLESKNKK